MKEKRGCKSSFWILLILIIYIVFFALTLIISLSGASIYKAGLISIAVLASSLIGCFITNRKYEKFVLNHSLAIRELSKINEEFHFDEIPDMNMRNTYDNKNLYNTLKPLDYLTYQLVFRKNEAIRAINEAKRNKELLESYKKRIGEIKEFDKYDTTRLPMLSFLRKYREKSIFNRAIKHPTTNFTILVTLELTKINGRYVTQKSEIFDSNIIRLISEKLSHKRGDFYTDEGVWQSISRVERARVTNKIRFAVFARDNNRCKLCGSKYDLEVDHIFPISKGGKSTFDNLQTLCHRCNSLKSDTVITYQGKENSKVSLERCPYCNAPLTLKSGRYGNFFGCTNYPRCKFTKNSN